MRPRLTSAVADARRAVRESLQILNLHRGELVLAAVSGGGDSVALAAALAFEAPRMGLAGGAVIVDHGLQSGSEDIAHQAKLTCEGLGLHPVLVVKVEVKPNGEGLEAAARAARYQAIERVRISEGAAAVLTGHNLEDQAETVLLGLARGSGLTSISGMESFDPARNLLRPFLGLSRSDLRTACRDQGLNFWEDPHNQDPKFLRVRARNLLATLEQELGPGFASALARTAGMAAEADEVITALAGELTASAKLSAKAKSVVYQVSKFAEAPRAVRTKALHLIATAAGAGGATQAQIQQVEELIINWHGQKPASLSGITVERVKDQLIFTKTKPQNPGAC